jgi:hypothetical protein
MKDFDSTEYEQAGLLKNRYYLVLEPLKDGDAIESFAVRAYATAPLIVDNEGEEIYDPTYVVLQGLLGQLNDEFDTVYENGLERVTLEAIAEEVPEDEIDPKHLKKIREIEGNVIQVEFGELQ